MAQSKRCKEITDLRRVIRDETAPPLARLNAATKLIENHGATERNSATIRKRVKALLFSKDPVIADRAAAVRDLLVRRLETKPATRILHSLMNQTGDDGDDVEYSRRPSQTNPGRYPRCRLFIPEVPSDGYEIGSLDVGVYVGRLKAAAGTFRLCDWTARLRVALAIGETDPIDWELVSQISLALYHEPEINGMSSLGSAISGHAYANQLPLPRPSVDLMTELERRS